MATAINRTELRRLIDEEQVRVIDVLPVHEYDESHISSAASIPLRQPDQATTAALYHAKTQVPPTMSRSIIATLAPKSRALIAAPNAADPEPRINRS